MKEKETSKLYNSITNINNQFIEEARAKAKKKKSGWLIWGAMAACLCLVIAGIAMLMLNNELPNQISHEKVEIVEFNGAEYVVCGMGEIAILQECGVSSELSGKLAGRHICYLEFSDYRYFPVEKADREDKNDIELFEYTPKPNENVYIMCKTGKYYAVIRRDSDGYHGLTD